MRPGLRMISHLEPLSSRTTRCQYRSVALALGHLVAAGAAILLPACVVLVNGWYMAGLLAFYTRFLAILAAALSLVWGFLGYSQPALLSSVTGSSLLGWGPALWFLYLALRFGNPRSASRFYAKAMTRPGRAMIVLFGMLSIATMVPGALLAVALLVPERLGMASDVLVPLAFVTALIYAVMAHFGSRPLAYREGLVRFEGEPVLEPGSILVRDALRYPYRG